MIALSVKFTGADIFKAFKDEDGELNKLRNVTFYILGGFSALAFILSIWGLCLLKCTNKCCTIVFGVCLLPTWIITFIFGCVIAWFSNSSPSTIQQFCNNDDYDSMFIRWGRDLVAEYDDGIGYLVNSIMCSRECPCPDVPNKSTWLNMDEDVLNRINRTKFKISTAGYTEFDFSGEGAVVYWKFSDCYRDILSGNTSRIQPLQAELRDRWKENQLGLAIDFANYFENEYKCSGICESAIFYYALEITEGKPEQVCLLFLKDEVQNNLSYMGIASIVAGLVMLFTFIFQYCLWADYTTY